MEKIKDFLKENGYELYGVDNIIEGNNEFLHIMIIKRENGYLVRNTVRCYFDRWANSEIELHFKTSSEVVNYLPKKECYLADAISELVSNVILETCSVKDDTDISQMIDFLYSFLKRDKE